MLCLPDQNKMRLQDAKNDYFKTTNDIAGNNSSKKSDNSKANKQEKHSATADQQKMNPVDRETARKIRAAIHNDKTLSTYAHNVKVIVQNGQVTLKGPVRSDDEKSAVETKATAIAGAGNVTNNLTVAPKSNS